MSALVLVQSARAALDNLRKQHADILVNSHKTAEEMYVLRGKIQGIDMARTALDESFRGLNG